MKDSKLWLEAVAEGERKRQREKILDALRVRFHTVPDEFTQAVNGLDDMDELGRLFRLAIRCKQLDDFRRALNRAATSHH
jgi:hypothetical protein